MISNADRHEVAQRLRELHLDPWDDAACEIAQCAGIACCNSECHGSNETPECIMMLASQLADLIEPSDSAQTVAEDMFGQMRHSTEQERVTYADMLARNSIELHPVDRDALLELVDEMETADPEDLHVAIDYVTECASRIREALGVEK